jgi:GH15 family glucan-1,4-alpha-glucosidase
LALPWGRQAATDDLDASVLLLTLVGFLPVTHERMRATIFAVERELGEGGLVRRWPSDRDLTACGGPGALSSDLCQIP